MSEITHFREAVDKLEDFQREFPEVTGDRLTGVFFSFLRPGLVALARETYALAHAEASLNEWRAEAMDG